MNCGDPQRAAFGAKIVGQSWKIPLVGRRWQSLAPPAQLSPPDSPMSDAPIITMTVPVTTGGKIRFRVLAGAKDRPIFK
ncbi:4626_t:CDS:1, partial [Acaulospora colombiana]